MDIRGFFTGSKKEKGEDDSSKKKRPAEEGVNLTPPPAAKAEIPGNPTFHRLFTEME